MTDTKKQDDVDPRHRLAQKYLQRAHDDLSAKEAEQPASLRRRSARLQGKPQLADLRPSIASSALLHGLMLMFVVTTVLLLSAVGYNLLNVAFIAGRAIALPVGILICVGLSYSSALYLGILESTSHGHTDPESALEGDWRDWFWTMPASWGVLMITAGVGWLFSRLAPDSMKHNPRRDDLAWLSDPTTLHAGNRPRSAQPISPPVLRTLATRPLIWTTFFALSFVLWKGLWWLAAVTWRDPPYLTMLWMGPITTVVLLIYAWSLGQLARWLTIGGR